jgi:hypothetical protein
MQVDDPALARLIAVTGPAGSSNTALASAVARVEQAPPGSPAVILVEGISDQAEEPAFRRGLAQAGLPPGPGRAGLERLGFYVCLADLEDEMIRALGAETIEQLIAAEGELTRFRTFTQQPAQRGRPAEQQLHRFMGTQSGRKARYARVLASALDPAQIPRPLALVLSHVTGRAGGSTE